MLFDIKYGGNLYSYDSRKNKILGLESPLSNPASLLEALNSNVKVYVQLTTRCNLNCKYCYLSINKREYHTGLSSTQDHRRIIAVLEDIICKFDGALIVFYGGEPLLAWDALTNIVEHFDRMVVEKGSNIAYSISTNGLLLNEEVVEYLCEKKISATISLDGRSDTMLITRGVASNRAIEHTVSILAERGNPAKITATIDPEAMPHIAADLLYLAELPVKSITFASCDSSCPGTYLTEDHARAFCAAFGSLIEKSVQNQRYDVLKKFSDLMACMDKIDLETPRTKRCGYGCTVFAVSESGDLYPCPSFLNVKDYANVGEDFKYPPSPVEMECSNCIAYSTCNGECHYTHYIAGRAPSDFMEAKCIINRCLTELALKTYIRLYVS